MTVQVLHWQFTVADFVRMTEAGIFAEDDRVELIDGEVRAMSPIGPRHAAIVKRLNALMSRQVADRAILSVQDPIQHQTASPRAWRPSVLWRWRPLHNWLWRGPRSVGPQVNPDTLR